MVNHANIKKIDIGRVKLWPASVVSITHL